MAKFQFLVEEGNDGWFVASCKQMPGVVSQGKTEASALRNLADAITAVRKVQAAAPPISERSAGDGK